MIHRSFPYPYPFIPGHAGIPPAISHSSQLLFKQHRASWSLGSMTEYSKVSHLRTFMRRMFLKYSKDTMRKYTCLAHVCGFLFFLYVVARMRLQDDVTYNLNKFEVSLIQNTHGPWQLWHFTVLVVKFQQRHWRNELPCKNLYNLNLSELRRKSGAARLLRFWVQIPPEAWMFFSFDCCVLSDWGLYVGLIARPEEFYRLWWVVCDLETSWMR